MPARRPRTSAASLELGRKLADARRDGPEKFRLEYQKRNLSRRHAYYLLKIGKLLRAGTITPKQVHEIGWTKLNVMLGHLRPKNARRLLQLANTSSAEELRRLISTGRKPTQLRCVNLYFTPGQYRLFEQALRAEDKTGRVRGKKKKETLLIRALRHSCN